MPRKLLVGGASRCGSLRGVKKVSPPTVPALPLPTANQVKRHSTSNPCVCNGDQLGDVTPDFEQSVDINFNNVSSRRQYRTASVGNAYSHVTFSLQNHCGDQALSMKKVTSGCGAGSNGQIHLAHVIVHSQPDSLPITPTEPSPSPYLMKGRLMSATQNSLEDQGIDVSSPGRHSPGGSSGGSSVSRHSLSSLDSGRASAPGSENKVINRRLSVHSYESTGSPQRRSYHSSSSSLASSGEDPHGTITCSANATISVLGQGPNVAEMVLHGLPDVEVLSNWLASLHFEEYITLFLQAGYDMPTITRMTPEDLTAIGITKPNHRRKMKAEIAKLNISDGIPEYKPGTLLEWLQLLRLEDYYSTLCQQQYDTIDRVTELTWEDLEDIGIQKLGHQKKILLAIKRIEDINQGRRPNLIPATKKQQYTEYQTNSSSNYSRPSTLNSIQPFAYPAQEVAIAMQRPKNSPSTDSIPEMKTFQQSPIREENMLPENSEICSSTMTSVVPQQSQPATDAAPFPQNGNSNYVLSPCRGRSLESLHSDENAPVPTTSYQPVMSYPTAAPVVPAERPKMQLTKDWKTTDLDTEQNYECEGTATLNRPKGMMKLRPIAKISAKTREEITEVMLDIPDHEFKSMLNNARTLDGWSSLDGSPRHGPSTVPRGSTMRRPPPPPPPKRSNSTKGERPAVEAKKDEPPPIKQRPPHLAPPSQRSSLQDPLKSHNLNSTAAEDFPPPPSPLHSAAELDKNKTGQGTEQETRDELFNNPLFQQKRKDSASSVDASALPFANEAVGTIKQKSSRPYPSLSAENTLRNSGSRKESSNPFLSQEHEYDRTSEAMSPGDVIDDIEHMLANLSDQLDAMLDDEQMQK